MRKSSSAAQSENDDGTSAIGQRPRVAHEALTLAREQAKQHQVPHLARQHQLFILNNTTIEYDRGKKPAASVLAVFSRRRFFSPRASAA